MSDPKSFDNPGGDVLRPNVMSVSDSNYCMINERGDYIVGTDANMRNANKALIAQESKRDEETSRSSTAQPSTQTTVTNTDDSKIDDSLRKNAEFPNRKIVIVDDCGKHQIIGYRLVLNSENKNNNATANADAPVTKQYDPSIDDRLPETVTLLRTADGGKVYLVGTAHFSAASQNDVSTIIQAVQPHIVLVELCKARIGILQLDEELLFEHAKNLSYQYMLQSLKDFGPYNGVLHVLLLRMAARIAKQLKMAPGGEFRRAFEEAKKVPNCIVQLADRPINITVQRAVRNLTWWETFELCRQLLSFRDSISKEEVELCKKRSLLDDMMNKFEQRFPAVGESFIKERDLYLTYSLQLASLPHRTPHGIESVRVVAVVGLGHISGIVENWGKVDASDILPIMRACHISLGVFVDIRYMVSMEATARIDEYDHAKPEVMYVVSNIPGPGVDIDNFESEYSLGCSCTLQCSDCPCTRGSPNYIDGRVLDDKLAGPIIECNVHCTCSSNCGNRLVQNGPLDSLVVSDVGKRGLGLLTSKRIRKGQFICEYAGEVIGIEEARHRIEANKKNNSMNYVLVVSEHIGDRTIVTCIDPKYFGNIGRYCNHSCQPNASLVPVRVEGVVPRLCLIASRDIEAGEEVTFHYAGGVTNSIQTLSDTPCFCGSTKCSGYLPHNPI